MNILYIIASQGFNIDGPKEKIKLSRVYPVANPVNDGVGRKVEMVKELIYIYIYMLIL